MPFVTIIIVLLFVGFIVYLIQTAPWIPVDPWFKNLIVGLIVFGAIIYLLNNMGVVTGIHLR